MSLADDLLQQAFNLANAESGKPKQASLRRAESAAYYALFHLFIEDASSRILPGGSAQLRDRISRAFQHAEMKKVCSQLRHATLPAALQSLLPSGVSNDLQAIAGVFLEAQEARHRADYDLSARFRRSTTFQLIDKVDRAVFVWKRIRKSDEATVFLAALTFASRWDR